jgi:hypothetical protein
LPALASRSYENSQHILSNRHTAGNCVHCIRGNVLSDASPASCTVITGAVSLGIRRSVPDTDGRRSSNVRIRNSLPECRYRTVHRKTLSCLAMRTFQKAELSFKQTSISSHHAPKPRAEWLLAPFGWHCRTFC